MTRFARAFLHFWSDFLIGDRLELFIGPIVALAGAAILVHAGLPGALIGAAYFATVVLIGAISLGMATRR
jgi:hypothetical protein